MQFGQGRLVVVLGNISDALKELSSELTLSALELTGGQFEQVNIRYGPPPRLERVPGR